MEGVTGATLSATGSATIALRSGAQRSLQLLTVLAIEVRRDWDFAGVNSSSRQGWQFSWFSKSSAAAEVESLSSFSFPPMRLGVRRARLAEKSRLSAGSAGQNGQSWLLWGMQVQLSRAYPPPWSSAFSSRGSSMPFCALVEAIGGSKSQQRKRRTVVEGESCGSCKGSSCPSVACKWMRLAIAPLWNAIAERVEVSGASHARLSASGTGTYSVPLQAF